MLCAFFFVFQLGSVWTHCVQTSSTWFHFLHGVQKPLQLGFTRLALFCPPNPFQVVFACLNRFPLLGHLAFAAFARGAGVGDNGGVFRTLAQGEPGAGRGLVFSPARRPAFGE